MVTKYTLTDEHRAQLAPWRDRWIRNALSTAPMDDAERVVIRAAIRGLYEAAGLKPPPDRRIVFVPSPFVARFAGGFAAWIWHQRLRATATAAATDAATDAATRDATDDATAAATDDATAAATADATDAATDAATRDATAAATRDATAVATRDATYAATDAATYAATDAATDAATYAATAAATDAATAAATDAATRDATRAATRDATAAATDAATAAATDAATDAATGAATYAATDAATRDATRAATRDATAAATDAATAAATDAATRDATAAATDAATWYRVPAAVLARVAQQFGGAPALECAQLAYRLWNGGNQWSAWVAFLSFFRHVARLDLDYAKWRHYETAARAGPRVMHREFCLVSERPTVLRVDARNRPHCEDGPFCSWRDGTALYAWHGTRVPSWIIECPDRITPANIEAETNAEIRRVMVERYGTSRYLSDSGGELIDQSRWGKLWRKDQPGDEPIVMVEVENSTPEPDGERKVYFLRVHPECRPMLRDGSFGERQELTAHAAVASTFGLRAEDYHPHAES